MGVLLQDRPGQAPRVALRASSVGLIVRDLDRVAAFYRDVVGLAVIAQGGDTVRLGAGGVTLLDLVHRPDAPPQQPGSAGLFHTAFLLPTRADLGAWLSHASRIGHRLDGAADHLVSEAVYFSDPEGNGIEIYVDRPAASWQWDGPAETPQVVMANRRLDVPGLLADAVGPWQGVPTGTCIGHVHLRVGDVPAAMAFYGRTLGLTVTRMGPGAAFMSTSGYHHHIATNTWHSAGAGKRDPAQAGLAWVTLEAATDAVASAVMRRGGSADLRDPWGTQINITSIH